MAAETGGLPGGLRAVEGTPVYGSSAWLSQRARLTPEREALVAAPRRLTYGELDSRVQALGAALYHRYGLRRHDRVAALMVNSPEWVELFFATARIGAILVPLNWRLTPRELDYQLRDSAARLLVVGPEQDALADQLARDLPVEARLPLGAPYEHLLASGKGQQVPVEAQGAFADPHLVLYTSGTTGYPKGAVLTHANVFWNCVNVGIAFGLQEADIALTLLPLCHAGGVGLFTIPALHAGARVVLPRAFDPASTCELIQSEQVSLVFGVPAMWLALLQQPTFTAADCPSIRSLGSGGAPCPSAVIGQLDGRGFRLLQGYGLTETAPGGTLLSVEDWRRKAGTVGKPMAHVELAVVAENGQPASVGTVGEVLFRGPNVFAGYWNLPQATAEAFTPDGWFRSGDLGVLDEEGFLTLVDRKKDMIISGGENIYSAEIEDVLYVHPSVAEAAIIGVADERWGEVPRAIVVPRPGEAVTAEELLDHCRAYLARYKVPRSIVFTDALPRNVGGKVVKPELRRLYGDA